MEAAKTAQKKWRFAIPSFLKRWDSLFYFAIFVLILSIAWSGYAVAMNHGAQTMNWDYTFQFVPLAYDFYDNWKTLLTTGHFPLYSNQVFIGTDNIGSNSYYGLFDPFLIPMILFPRNFIPQYFLIATWFKFMVTALFMRAYLRYMGIKEWTARLGALALTFSGYMNFMMGFPSFVSALTYLPLMLLGIEKAIKERKPYILALSVFLEGITSFFFLVVFCIFGVLYAMWRFFTTLKQRSAKENWTVLAIGVAGYALGLCLCAFSVIPSLRESALSGRASSIGGAYLDSLLAALKNFDLRSFFALMFQEVGVHPAREWLVVLSFFFPTGGFTSLPLAHTSYDAWTASLFVYTPFIILFFVALSNSILERKWHHLLAVFVFAFFCLTNFAYFFFFAFTGNGYGRWQMVVIPLLIYYGCYGFDRRKNTPRFVPLIAAGMALLFTIIIYFATETMLKGETFTKVNGMSYWQSTYIVASQHYNGLQSEWYLYYQVGWVVLEAFLMFVGHRKKWLPGALFAALCIEIIVMGNLTYVYNGIWFLDSSFAGGSTNREETSLITDRIIAHEDTNYFRTYSDTFNSKYGLHVAGVSGASEFHSLMNFDVESFALQNQIKYPGNTINSYETTGIYNPSWSGAYGNKRMGTDLVLGYRYYVIHNDYSAWKESQPEFYFPTANVPFGAEEMEDMSFNRDRYRVYRVKDSSWPRLGWAVGDGYLYRIGAKEGSPYLTSFFSNTSGMLAFREAVRVGQVQIRGAMFEDNEVLPEDIEINEVVPNMTMANNLATYYGLTMLRVGAGLGLTADYYETKTGDSIFPSTNASYVSEGPGYFINHHVDTLTQLNVSPGRFVMKRDLGKMVIRPTDHTYFNSDTRGCYIELKTYPDKGSGATNPEWNNPPRIYAIGDQYDDNGNLVRENAVLSYEFYALENMRRMDTGNHGNYSSRNSTFGLYCHGGLVKYIVFNYKGSGTIGLSLGNIALTVDEYFSVKNKLDQIRTDALRNVKQVDANSFTFTANYDRTRVIKTHLGFDKGWQAYAAFPGEKEKALQMVKLDGGLVGFIYPGKLDDQGNVIEVSCRLVYRTPYSGVSAALWAIGVMSFSGFVIYDFIKGVKTRRKELELQAKD